MAEFEKKVRKELSRNGCYFLRRGKGDHDVWHNPANKRNVSVDSKIKSRHTANAIMKEAGIEHKF